MDVKAAVATAKQHVADLFADEKITNLGLEEVEFHDADNTWHITLAFSRPWDTVTSPFIALREGQVPKRSFKIIKISDNEGRVLSVKNRDE
jgi:hypothetical protein